MIEKRKYERLAVDIECTVFTDEKAYNISGRIINISEEGIAVIFDGDCDGVSKLKCGMTVFYGYTNGERLCNGEAEIVRVERNPEDVIIGCKVIKKGEF